MKSWIRLLITWLGTSWAMRSQTTNQLQRFLGIRWGSVWMHWVFHVYIVVQNTVPKYSHVQPYKVESKMFWCQPVPELERYMENLSNKQSSITRMMGELKSKVPKSDTRDQFRTQLVKHRQIFQSSFRYIHKSNFSSQVTWTSVASQTSIVT